MLQSQVRVVAELFVDFLDLYLVQDQHFQGFSNSPAWVRYFEDMFASSPAMCHYLQERQEWYDNEVWEVMQRGLTRHEQGFS